jgi:hypothetical protein
VAPISWQTVKEKLTVLLLAVVLTRIEAILLTSTAMYRYKDAF